MKQIPFLILFLSLFNIFSSCKKERSLFSLEEQEILFDCNENPLTDSLEIIKNLMGTWELVYSFCGNCSESESDEGILKISDRSGILYISKMNRKDTTYNFTWELSRNVIFNNSINSSFQLETEPYIYAIAITNFCESFMSSSPTHVDGGFHLYQKQE